MGSSTSKFESFVRRLQFALIRWLKAHLSPRSIERLKQGREFGRSLREMRPPDPAQLRADGMAEVEALTLTPRIALVMPTYKTDIPYLDAAIASVREQYYPHW